jgi:hypothetical protein
MKKRFLKLIKPVFLFAVGLSLTIGCSNSNGNSGVVDPGIVLESVTESIDHEAGGRRQNSTK